MTRIDLMRFHGITEGPWEWVPNWRDSWHEIRSQSGEVIVDDGSNGGEYAQVIDRHSQNARAIASVPDLIDALREAYAEIDRMNGASDGD